MIIALSRNGHYRSFEQKETGGIWWHLVEETKREAFVPAQTTMVLNPQWSPVEKVNAQNIEETLTEKLSDRLAVGIYLPDSGFPIGSNEKNANIEHLYNTHYLRGQNEAIAAAAKADDAPFVLKACASLSRQEGARAR